MVTTPYALIFGPADVSHMMKDMQRLYDTHPQVRARFGQVARSAGVDVDTILRKTPLLDDASCMQVVSLGLLAGMLGIADDIIEQRGAPSCVGGISLGEVAALCVAGGLTLDDATALIRLRVDMPEADDETVGFVMVMEEGGRAFYHQPPEMRIAVDYGLIHQGIGSLLMVAGLRRTLEGRGQEGSGVLEVLPPALCNSAYHTPYRRRIAEQVAAYLQGCTLPAPRYPVVTCLPEIGVVNDPQGVKQMCVRGETETLSVPAMIRQMQSFGVADVICIGPFLRSLNLDFGGVSASFRDEQWVDDISSSLSAVE
ncbi:MULTISPECIES: hypothetical protein [unclassified Serratia (in: enterobacteria)]|uniref:hypothetical protein n=1 Tax=unclassified Serratia (in: enterobacteria) TaxID=2647522 RepID=UPI0027F857F1|nr:MULTISPECIES: hypothetical protein [unclassified Serratia (in: enterobacteria)]MDQ7097753.1 hypothetical protein [Serratia sp. MF2]MDQ7105266.1 hypothetical protein [Serratia sp. MF1(2023)]